MVTSSNNAKSTSDSKNVPAANQERNPAVPPNPAKSADPVDEDEHLIRKSDTLIGGRI